MPSGVSNRKPVPVPRSRSNGSTVSTSPPVEPYDGEKGTGTGFRFDTADGTGLLWALDRALAAFRQRDAWTALMKRAMAGDFSWDRAAGAYVELYRRALEKA